MYPNLIFVKDISLRKNILYKTWHLNLIFITLSNTSLESIARVVGQAFMYTVLTVPRKVDGSIIRTVLARLSFEQP